MQILTCFWQLSREIQADDALNGITATGLPKSKNSKILAQPLCDKNATLHLGKGFLHRFRGSKLTKVTP
jgi:hypothetical protein